MILLNLYSTINSNHFLYSVDNDLGQRESREAILINYNDGQVESIGKVQRGTFLIT